MMLTCAQLQESVPNTVEYAKCSPERIGHAVRIFVIYLSFALSLFLFFKLRDCVSDVIVLAM